MDDALVSIICKLLLKSCQRLIPNNPSWALARVKECRRNGIQIFVRSALEVDSKQKIRLNA